MTTQARELLDSIVDCMHNLIDPVNSSTIVRSIHITDPGDWVDFGSDLTFCVKVVVKNLDVFAEIAGDNKVYVQKTNNGHVLQTIYKNTCIEVAL